MNVCRICKERPVGKSGHKRPDGSPYWMRKCYECARQGRRGKRTQLERFEEKVDKSGDCWIFTGSCPGFGHGHFGVDSGKYVYAHRWAYAHYVGPIPDGMQVCHKCDVPACVNPDHLFIGTQRDNVLDMHRKGRFVGNRKGR